MYILYMYSLVKEKTYFYNISVIDFFCWYLFTIIFHIYKFLWYRMFLKLNNTRGNTYNKIILKKKKNLESNYKQFNKLQNKLSNE